MIPILAAVLRFSNLRVAWSKAYMLRSLLEGRFGDSKYYRIQTCEYMIKWMLVNGKLFTASYTTESRNLPWAAYDWVDSRSILNCWLLGLGSSVGSGPEGNSKEAMLHPSSNTFLCFGYWCLTSSVYRDESLFQKLAALQTFVLFQKLANCQIFKSLVAYRDK